MNITIKVGYSRLSIFPRLPNEEYYFLRKKLTYIFHGFEYTKQYRDYGWDGRVALLYKNQTAPSGCVHRIHYLLTKYYKHAVSIEYESDYPPRGSNKIHGFELKTFQKRAVQEILKYRRGIIEAPMRAGKTAIAASAINKIDHYMVWYVTYGKDLVKQAVKDFEYHLDVPIGYLSESKYKHGMIMITSYQAITRIVNGNRTRGKLRTATQQRNKRIMKYLNDAKAFFFDECHHMLAPKTKRLLEEMKSAGYVVGMSGTPRPDNTSKLQLEAVIGSIILRVRSKTLVKQKRIAKPKIIIYKLPYRWFSVGLKAFPEVYQSNIVESTFRNLFIAEIAVALEKEGKTTFIMIRRLQHGPILRALIPGSVFVHGKIKSEKRATLYAQLQSKELKCIIGTVGKEGLNIPKLDAVINAEGYKSKIGTLQKLRSLTAVKGKKYGIIVDFYDRGKFLTSHSRKRIKLYQKLGDSVFREAKVPANYYEMEGTRWQQLV